MVCYTPLQAFRASTRSLSSDGMSLVRPLSFRWSSDFDRPIKLACQQCLGCRLERSRQWAGRCVHESQMWDDAWFLTLTYDDTHLPSDNSLNHKHVQDFLKRLRDRLGYPPLAYYMCGEYGDVSGRPHYHMIIFGLSFNDLKHYKDCNGFPLYTSAWLEDVWQMGFCPIGTVTFESAAYVARYIMKKVTGDRAAAHYERVDFSTGEIFNLTPEYTRMSLKPSIGYRFYDKYKFDIYSKDEVIINAYPCRPFRFYDLKFKSQHPDLWEDVKNARDEVMDDLLKDDDYIYNHTPERLLVRETVKVAQFSQLVRTL